MAFTLIDLTNLLMRRGFLHSARGWPDHTKMEWYLRRRDRDTLVVEFLIQDREWVDLSRPNEKATRYVIVVSLASFQRSSLHYRYVLWGLDSLYVDEITEDVLYRSYKMIRYTLQCANYWYP